jgi:hypothetical protein
LLGGVEARGGDRPPLRQGWIVERLVEGVLGHPHVLVGELLNMKSDPPLSLTR